MIGVLLMLMTGPRRFGKSCKFSPTGPCLPTNYLTRLVVILADRRQSGILGPGVYAATAEIQVLISFEKFAAQEGGEFVVGTVAIDIS